MYSLEILKDFSFFFFFFFLFFLLSFSSSRESEIGKYWLDNLIFIKRMFLDWLLIIENNIDLVKNRRFCEKNK